MRVVWTPQAAAALAKINDDIAEQSPQAATSTLRHIVDRTKDLAVFPRQGRNGRVAGTHELVIPRTPYIVVYRLTRAQVDVVRQARRPTMAQALPALSP